MNSDKPLPTGTVTFLFSDIEGNTPLWERDPQAMEAALQIHNAILRLAIEINGGAVFKIVGDEFQAAFPTALQGLMAALQAQRGLLSARWNELGPLRVRMGIHTGEAHLDEHGDEYAVSHTKNRGHRVMEAGHGGQILLSQESADLCQRGLPPEVILKDLGEHHIRNWKLPEHFYQVVAPGLTKDFPPLRTQVEPKHNLPVQLTSFVGRKKEIRQVENLLKKNRLVTLTGPGGTGKTRLALRVAVELLGRYPDGAWLVELAPLADPEKVPMAVLRALGLREKTGREALSLLEDFLVAKKLLLILDNCEHLIEACALLADALLHACPNLQLIASSREALGIGGETSFRVPPLSLPDLHILLPLKRMVRFEAIRLFVERASAASPSFRISAENAPAIAQVCQRLDGIPLAIELAAARVKMLQVGEIAQRLDDRFRLLTGGSRAALPRYQTLRASIDWSYELFSPVERSLLQRLSVFAESWTLQAAEYVGCGEGIESCEILDLLGQLVNKSLVSIEAEAGLGMRYRMLETIRQYAHEKLVEAGCAEQARDRHLQYLVEYAEKVAWKIRGPDQAAILEHLEAELDNICLALAWSLEKKGKPGWDPEPGLRLAAALFWFWFIRGHIAEGLTWLERLLASEVEEGDGRLFVLSKAVYTARALFVAGYLARASEQDHKGIDFLEKSRDIYQKLGPEEKTGLAWVTITLGVHKSYQADFSLEKKVEESLGVFHEAGDLFGKAECLLHLGVIAGLAHEFEKARKYWEESLELRKIIGDQDGAAGSLWNLAILAFIQGDEERARYLGNEGRVMFSKAYNDYAIHQVIALLGFLDWIQGEYDQAVGKFVEILSAGRRLGEVYLVNLGLSSLGRLALSQGKYDLAAERFSESMAFNCRMGYKVGMAAYLCDLGNLALAHGEDEQALRRYAEALYLGQETDEKAYASSTFYGLGRAQAALMDFVSARASFEKAISTFNIGLLFTFFEDPLLQSLFALEGIACLDAVGQGLEKASRLLGATQSWHERWQRTRTPRERQERESAVATLREKMGEDAFYIAWVEGKAMTLKQAIAYAKEDV